MSGAELIRAAGPVFWILFALSVYTLYLVLAGLFRRKATARTLDRLGDLAQFAPLLGLFGTSLGMIRAFLALGQGEPGASGPGHRRGPHQHRDGPFRGRGGLRGRVLLGAMEGGKSEPAAPGPEPHPPH